MTPEREATCLNCSRWGWIDPSGIYHAVTLTARTRTGRGLTCDACHGRVSIVDATLTSEQRMGVLPVLRLRPERGESAA